MMVSPFSSVQLSPGCNPSWSSARLNSAQLNSTNHPFTLATARCTYRAANFFDYNERRRRGPILLQHGNPLCLVFGHKHVNKRKRAAFNDQLNFKTLTCLLTRQPAAKQPETERLSKLSATPRRCDF
ncbi:hypothetical protein KR215_000899 [Drosophila sulfurigaster]|nr:hypothetical protein KR215_000899 [Drosophila sulfurigaster]